MKKILFPILILLTIFAVNAANKTWLGTGASAKAAANWVGGTLPATGDVWILSSTNNVALTVDSNFTNAGIAVDAGYTATVSLQSYTITTTGDVNLGGATLAAGTSTLTLTGAAAQTITSAGETWYDVTINRSTAGTCLFADATSLHTLTGSATNTQVISWTGTTMTASGNINLLGTGTHNLGNGAILTGATSLLHIDATLTAPTATSCVLTFNGAGCTLESNKATTYSRFVIGAAGGFTNSSTTTCTFLESSTIVTIGANATFTNNGSISIRPTGSIAVFSFGAGVTFNGTGAVLVRLTSTGINITLPAITYTGSGAWSIYPGSADGTCTLTGNLNVGTVALDIGDLSSANFTFSSSTYNITCGQFVTGSAGGTTCTANFGSGTHTITSFRGDLANQVVTTLNLQTSQWSCAGNFTFASNHTITGTAATTSVTFTGVGTTTSNGKTFPGNVVINSAGVLRTMADKFRCDGNFTVTAGKVIFGSLARDSIVGDYTNNLTGTDTLNRNSDSLWLGGSFTGNLRVKNDLSRSYLYGTALCNFTSNGTTVNYFDIRGDTRAKQMKLIDRYHGRKTMVTTGTLNTNGMDCFSDSFLVVQDSIATVIGDTISSRKITFGASAKPINGTPLLLYFGLALADTMRDSLPTTTSLGKLVVNKTGSNLTFANKGRYDNVVITDGAIAFNAATDTLRCDSLNWQATDSSYITAPIIIGKTAGFVCAAGAKFAFSATGKIIMPDCTEGTTNGNTTVVLTYPAECTATSHRRRPTLNCGLMISTDD